MKADPPPERDVRKSCRRRATGSPRPEAFDPIANGVIEIKELCRDIKEMIAKLSIAKCSAHTEQVRPMERILETSVAEKRTEEGDGAACNLKATCAHADTAHALLATPPRMTSTCTTTPPVALASCAADPAEQWELLLWIPQPPLTPPHVEAGLVLST